MISKDLDQPARVVGTLQVSGGTYTVKGLEFRLISGTIRFAERPQASPELNALLETRLKRYHLLGRAELLAARWLGLDEINVNMAPNVTTSMQLGGSLIESVEVGKYVIPERLFGSYKLEPSQTLAETPRHTVGAALNLTENLSLEGAVTAKVQEAQKPTTDSVETPQRRLQAEEAFIKFRWKF